MEYNDNTQQAAEITRLVLPTLSRLNIPVTPVNYALWYEYYLGRSEELNSALEQIENGSQPYDSKTAKKLFYRYVTASGADKVEKAGEEIRRVLSELAALMGDAGIDVKRFGSFLNNSKDDLGDISDFPKVRTVLNSLLSETTEMIESNKKFERRLEETSEEMSLLRRELSEMRQQVSVDALTGLANRRTFDESLMRAMETAVVEHQNLCLLMVDLDHFKKINDQHGHLIGDKVLKYVGVTLKKMIKGKDLAARFGGEEFAIILEDTPNSGAITLAEKIRMAVEQSKLRRTDTGENIGTITVSIGLDSMRDGDTRENLLERADKAMYHSKKMGRNRISEFQSLTLTR